MPLHLACRYGRIDMVELLLEFNAAIDAQDKWGVCLKFIRLHFTTLQWTTSRKSVSSLFHRGQITLSTMQMGTKQLILPQNHSSMTSSISSSRIWWQSQGVALNWAVLTSEYVSSVKPKMLSMCSTHASMSHSAENATSQTRKSSNSVQCAGRLWPKSSLSKKNKQSTHYFLYSLFKRYGTTTGCKGHSTLIWILKKKILSKKKLKQKIDAEYHI